MSAPVLVLASQSAARRQMLAAAGVPHEVLAAGVDEESAKASLRADGADPRTLADALAELKATRISGRVPDALVLGCDQVLALGDGDTLDKPGSRADAAAQLLRMRDAEHRLISAAVICEAGRPVWRHVATATLRVRAFSEAWLEAYLDGAWPEVAGAAGSYHLEGLGAQLFTQVRGSHFAVLGLPLLPLLDYLRVRGVLAA